MSEKPRLSIIIISTTYDAKRIYTDSGTGAKQDLSVWKPVLPDGYYMIGHFGQQDHAAGLKGPIPIVKPLDPTTFAPPSTFEQKWNDRRSGGNQDVAFWRVIAPPGYVALGDVVSVGNYNPPNELINEYACIRSDLVEQGKAGPQIWADHGSGASQDGSMWAVQPTTYGVTGYFRVQSGYSAPHDVYTQCLKGASM